ncbi:MAG: LysR family transcriptional regulator [Burkholderiaceae bacterium]|nr:LysR family transcriptional regulator [Burkholderiaceae bacterium]
MAPIETLTANAFDWSLIRSFLAVLDTGSLLGAARRLGGSQPTVGRHIEALERQLGVALFERTGRGLVPTEAARRIAPEARQVQAGAERLAVAAQPGARAGVVRISASRMIALYVLPELLALLQDREPDIDVALVASDEVSNLLRRDADIAVRMVPPSQASLIARRIGAISIVPCARRDYLDRFGTPRSAADLAHHRLIGPDRDLGTLEQMRASTLAVGIDPTGLRRAFRCDDYPTQLAAVRAGLGIGFASEPMVRRDPSLVVLSLPLPMPELPVWLVVHREIRGSASIRRVYDFLAAELGALFGAARSRRTMPSGANADGPGRSTDA